jgi:nicotinamidase-related amidase
MLPAMTTALLFIDVQRNMLEGDSPVPAAAEVRPALAALLATARAAGAPVVHVQNDGPPGEPDEPHTDGWHLVFPAADGELVVRKETADTFAANPELARALRDRGVDRVVVAGLQSEYCVTATSHGALGHGFDVTLASGAHATYDAGAVSAADIATGVEKELGTEGVEVLPAAGVRF